MNEVRILSLTLENFKGVRSFELAPQGQDADVRGDNAAGKSTLADAWFWLTTGADSHGSSVFEIKTLGPDGQPLHNLAHAVVATIEAGGRTVTLAKSYKEVWEKKRGSADESFSGHTTEHTVDGVPVKASEFAQRLAAIAPPADWRLLGDPAALLGKAPWQERRAALLAMCGDLTDEEVLAQADLPALKAEIAGGRTFDDALRVAKARKKEANERLKTIPARIDETERAASGATPPSEKDVKDAEQAVQDAETALAQAKATTADADHAAKARELDAAVREAEAALALARSEARGPLEDARTAALAEIATAQARTRELGQECARLDREAQRLEEDLARLRAEHGRIDGTTFDEREDCPTCGQKIPEDTLAESKAKFNAERSASLEKNVAEGKAAKNALIETKARAEDVLAALADAQALEDKAKEKAESLSGTEGPDLSGHPATAALEAAKEALAQHRTNVPAPPDLAPYHAAVEAARYETNLLYGARAKAEAAQSAQARIAELEAEEKETVKAAETAERLQWECEEFVRTKVGILEGRAAAATPGVEWKLFRELVNGGVEECCEATVGGVPYPALNHGAQVQAGLACIEALARSKGLALPVWVDGAESVTRIPQTTGQQVRLTVDEGAKALTVQNTTRKELLRA